MILESLQWLKAGKGGEVVTSLKPLLKQFPGHSRLHHLLGLAYEQCDDFTNAIHHVSRAIALQPDQVEAYKSLALLLKKTGKTQVALARILDALRLEPERPDLHFVLGDICMDQGMMKPAMDGFAQAINLQPEFLAAWINLGLCHKAMGQLHQARLCFEHAVTMDGQAPHAHVNLALTLLLLGEYGKGFDAFEWRFQLPEGHGLAVPPPVDIPRWNGEPVSGKKILVIAEQGYGDTIQFVRFLPLMQSLGAETFTVVASPLEPLLKGQPGMGRVQSSMAWEVKMDYHVPMMSLGKVFARSLEQIPTHHPYLFADPEKSRHWHQCLPRDCFKIGLVWEGKPLHKNDPLRRRSASLAALAPLAQGNENILFVSLQRDAPREQLGLPPNTMKLWDAGPQIHNFADAAAIMDNLDLIITIDTATAHMAGALNKPVWVLLPMAPDWRWGIDRNVSPWYPSSRLYRQTRPNHWQEPVEQMLADLKNWP
ncbi:MAG: TPR REGION protein [Magnetococcales bacterium]|nr:TPR REGION protein [Magnetococcales bacterium]